MHDQPPIKMLSIKGRKYYKRIQQNPPRELGHVQREIKYDERKNKDHYIREGNHLSINQAIAKHLKQEWRKKQYLNYKIKHSEKNMQKNITETLHHIKKGRGDLQQELQDLDKQEKELIKEINKITQEAKTNTNNPKMYNELRQKQQDKKQELNTNRDKQKKLEQEYRKLV